MPGRVPAVAGWLSGRWGCGVCASDVLYFSNQVEPLIATLQVGLLILRRDVNVSAHSHLPSVESLTVGCFFFLVEFVFVNCGLGTHGGIV